MTPTEEQETPPKVVVDIVRAVRELPRVHARFRLAVTPVEYEQIRRYCLERDGRFHERLAGIPLVRDTHAENPPLTVEYP